MDRALADPVAVKDIFCTEGVPTTAGSRILEGYRPPYTATAVRRLRGGASACSGRRTWTSSRWAPPTRTPPTARCSIPGTASAFPAAPRAARRRRWPGGSRLGDRHGHGRLDPPAGGAVRGRRVEADLRRSLPLRDDRVRLLARPVRAADARRHRRGAAPVASPAPRFPATPPRSESTAASSCRSART